MMNKNSMIEKFKRIKIDIVVDILKLIILFPISFILRPILNKKNIWLIEEKPTEANDNGYALLKYIKEDRPDINVYYVIDKKSKNIDKVKNISKIIKHKSIKHWIYYFDAKVIAVTQKYANPCPAIFYVLHNLKLIKGKRVFLQHGITKDNIECYQYDVSKFDLFVCGAKKEFEYIKTKFGYPSQSVIYTGFARFDKYNVNNNIKERFILICPTWRNWITDKNKNYEYFEKWNELINNEKFNEFLEKNNIYAKVILHQEMNKFKDKIKSKYENVQVLKNDEINYDENLSKCLMLITDFSSVFFDIAYMKKPIIYYQFDTKEFREKHLQEGYFSYEEDGFGEIFEESKAVIEEIIKIEKENFSMQEKYLKRVNLFFERRDNKNCQRIVDEIEKII